MQKAVQLRLTTDISTLTTNQSYALRLMISRKKKLLFAFITVAALILLLATVEMLLRIALPSLNNPLFSELDADRIESYQINRNYLRKYFPSGSPIVPELKPTIFRKYKTKNTFRIVCLGESSMFGTPYQLNANIPGIVRKQLRHLYPEKEIEVINLGAAAINSNVILNLAKQLVEIQPDLVLLYTGHNEFYGPEGIGASWLQRHIPATVQLKYSLSDFRLIALLDRYVMPHEANTPSGEKNLMKQVSQNNSVHLQSEDSQRIFRLFESNLNEIAAIFKRQNIPLIVSDITSNLLFPPFLSDTVSMPFSSQTDFALIGGKIQSGDLDSALERLKKILPVDSTNAFVHYSLGRIYLAMNKPAPARYHLLRARDEDLLKFRAPGQINTIITKAARQWNVPSISSDSLFASLSASELPANTLFHEHLHPTPKGYYEIAGLFVKKILQLNMILSDKPPGAALLPFQYDSLSIPWLDLAYGDLSIQRLTQQWPFQDYPARMLVIKNCDSTLLHIARDVFTFKTSLTDGCYQTALRFQQLQRYSDAQTTYTFLSEEYPRHYYPYYLSGVLHRDEGNLERAVEQYARSLQCNPEYLFAHIDIGLLKINLGKFDEAISHLRTAERLAEKEHSSSLVKASIYYGLSAAYANKNDLPRATYFINESVRLAPGYDAAQQLQRSLHTHR